MAVFQTGVEGQFHHDIHDFSRHKFIRIDPGYFTMRIHVNGQGVVKRVRFGGGKELLRGQRPSGFGVHGLTAILGYPLQSEILVNLLASEGILLG